MELIWRGCYENGEPYLGDASDVELLAEWPGETGRLVDALVRCGGDGEPGLIEPAEGRQGCYQVHDLFDHAPQYVQRRMKREAERQANGKTISDLRRAAAECKWEKERSKRMQVAASDYHLDANDATPAPAPAPAQIEEAQPSASPPTEARTPAPRPPDGVVEVQVSHGPHLTAWLRQADLDRITSQYPRMNALGLAQDLARKCATGAYATTSRGLTRSFGRFAASEQTLADSGRKSALVRPESNREKWDREEFEEAERRKAKGGQP